MSASFQAEPFLIDQIIMPASFQAEPNLYEFK